MYLEWKGAKQVSRQDYYYVGLSVAPLSALLSIPCQTPQSRATSLDKMRVIKPHVSNSPAKNWEIVVIQVP